MSLDPNSRRAVRCEVFCRVIDNFGDAAVCWRLARQLAKEHGWQVRLWIDELAPLEKLAPQFKTHALSSESTIEVAHWTVEPLELDDPDVVIEAFACNLPDSVIEAMARQSHPPVWLNLEYLSAESWVADFHGRASPHPRFRLVKHFFFPGFGTGTGGVLCESDYVHRRQRFDAALFRAEFGLPQPQPGALTVSLFSYPNPVLAALLEAWRASPRAIELLYPGMEVLPEAAGALSVHALPFLPQARYDELLWACDLNFVRGEDSFIRGLLAGRPMVWNIYPQDEASHLAKLDAFLSLYRPDDPALASPLACFWHAWNGQGQLDWTSFSNALPGLASHARSWAQGLLNGRESGHDLASQLVSFCLPRLK